MSDVQSARLIDVAIKTLREEILPEISDGSARIKIDHVTRVLRAASARMDKRQEGLQVYTKALSKLISASADAGNPEADRSTVPHPSREERPR